MTAREMVKALDTIGINAHYSESLKEISIVGGNDGWDMENDNFYMTADMVKKARTLFDANGKEESCCMVFLRVWVMNSYKVCFHLSMEDYWENKEMKEAWEA